MTPPPSNNNPKVFEKDPQILKMESINRTPKIMAFICHWADYQGDFITPIEPVKFPPNIDAVRVLCAARVNRPIITKAFSEGVDGIIIIACNNCKHKHGDVIADERVIATKSLLKNVGINPQRLKFVKATTGKDEDIAKEIFDFEKEIKELALK
ncbi:MAG: hydrogenase iron-sulfur subunit [Promethearchaeota archaeon]